jgi:signal transduction histidine kinase/tetratricopeptide (TPR) repeat protein/ActR/RegA family two-component response regulator
MIINRRQAWLFWLVAFGCIHAGLGAASGLEGWREEMARARYDAENDAPAAYVRVQRLVAELPSQATPLDHARAYNVLARIENLLGLINDAQRRAEAARQLAIEHCALEVEAESGIILAFGLERRGLLADARKAVLRSLDLLENSPRLDLLCEALQRDARINFRVGATDVSVGRSLRAMDAAQALGEPRLLAIAHHSLGSDLYQSRRYEEAREQFEQMRLQARAARSKALEADAVGSLAMCAGRLGWRTAAEAAFREAAALFREVGAIHERVGTEQNLAYNLNNQGRASEALALLDEIVEVYGQYPNPLALCHALSTRSWSRLLLGDLVAAAADAEQSYALAREKDIPLYLSQSAQRLATVAAAMGDYRRAYEMVTVVAEADSRAARERIDLQVVELERRHAAERRQREIAELQHRATQQQAELRLHMWQRRFLITLVSGGSAVLMITVCFLIRSRRTNRSLAQAHASAEAANKRLEIARRAAEAASAARGQFLANMSHEIRTPMNGVIGMVDELAATTLDAEQREICRVIQGSAESLLTIINDILDFSKIEHGKLQIERVSLGLRELIMDTAALFRPLVRSKGLRLDVALALDLPGCVLGDPVRLRQVLSNLIGNAVKFTARGSVTLTVDAIARDTLRFAVRDTGIGISPEAQTRLFQPFVQADMTHARKFGGTGLGLAISRQLVDLMGGRMGVTSELGRGATFWFQLPLIESAAEPSVRLQADVERQTYRSLRVLVVDDNQTNRVVAQRMLERFGHVVDLAEHGGQAFECLAATPCDVVLMDCQMPVVDGYEATKHIRSGAIAGVNARLPIVGLTACALPEDRERALAAGMDDYVTKPLKIDQLGESFARLGLSLRIESRCDAA